MPQRATIFLCIVMLGCSHGEAADKPPAQPSFVRGDVKKSGSRKASEERPQPWDEEKRRFPEDGLNLEGYQQRAHSEHTESHSRSSLSMESFSHPACAALDRQDRTTCPLTRLKWSGFKEVAGGASVMVSAARQAVRRLRRMVLCHVAFGKARGHRKGCPLHLAGVRTRVTWKDGQAVLMLTTANKERVEDLRDLLEYLAD